MSEEKDFSWAKDQPYSEIESRYPVPPEIGEKYPFKKGSIPASDFLQILEEKGTSRVLSRRQLVEVARQELRRLGCGDVEVRVTKEHGTDAGAPYADATASPIVDSKGVIVGRGVKLHPVLQYMGES